MTSRGFRVFETVPQATQAAQDGGGAEFGPQARDMHLDGVRGGVVVGAGNRLLQAFFGYDQAHAADQALQHQPFTRRQFDFAVVDASGPLERMTTTCLARIAEGTS